MKRLKVICRELITPEDQRIAVLSACLLYTSVLGLIYTIKGFEVAASQAAFSGELNDVLLALNLSPLIHSDRDAEQLAREMILAHEKWLPNFAATIEKLKA